MELTREADYAIRCALEAARVEWISTAEVAERQDIPPSFLGKIVASLAKAGILRTRRGTKGGMALAAPAGSVTLLQVIEAVQGPMRINWCAADPPLCDRSEICPASPVCAQAQEELERVFGISLGDLLDAAPDPSPFANEGLASLAGVEG